MQCSSEELAEVILPCLVPSLTLWQYLSLRAEAASRSSTGGVDTSGGVTDMAAVDKSCNRIDIAVMLDEYAALHREVQNMCNEKLEIGPPDKPVVDLQRHDEVMNVEDASVAAAADVSSEPVNTASLDADIVSDGHHVLGGVDDALNETDAADSQKLNSSVETEVRVASSGTGEAVPVGDLGLCSIAASDASDVPHTAELPPTSAATAEGESMSTLGDAVAEQLTAINTIAATPPNASDSADGGSSSSLTNKSDLQPVAVVVDNDLLQVNLCVVFAVIL
jgi:hypothetical protein